jgi:hypothetical protein
MYGKDRNLEIYKCCRAGHIVLGSPSSIRWKPVISFKETVFAELVTRCTHSHCPSFQLLFENTLLKLMKGMGEGEESL